MNRRQQRSYRDAYRRCIRQSSPLDPDYRSREYRDRVSRHRSAPARIYR
ncbi:hypothetical protein [Microbulbifer sediminum]|nr:hypothetical protein [Microbulbifer sediminum]